MKTMLSLLLAAFTLVGLSGCNDNSPPKLDENYMKSAEELGKTRREIFVRANGNYDQMSAEDKKTYLEGFKGDETQAQRFWDLMKNPPNSSVPSGLQGGQAPN